MGAVSLHQQSITLTSIANFSILNFRSLQSKFKYTISLVDFTQRFPKFSSFVRFHHDFGTVEYFDYFERLHLHCGFIYQRQNNK